MHRLLVSYPAPADPARFMDYYVGSHVPLARQLPGLQACRWMRPQALGPAEAVPFLLFEADFESEAAMFAALGSELGAKLAADVPNYSPAGATLAHYAVPAATPGA
jgi:uncharacterized protein (TIGR02118 family)